jgi:outer membrane protein assembly factor BamA
MARILIIAVCLCGFSQAQNTPQRQQSVQSEQNPLEPISPPAPATIGPGVIEGVDFRGSRQSSQDTLRAAILSKVGDAYNEDAVGRDVIILRLTNHFENVRASTEEGKRGGVILHFVVTDRPPAH